MKGFGAPAAELHRDEYDEGRLQCAIMLTEGAFTACPRSHLLRHQSSDSTDGHYHTTTALKERLQQDAPALEIAAGPGDLYIFKGGSFVHGSPAVSQSHPAPRIVTYSSFWPTDTKQGQLHAAGKCACKRPY